MNEKKATRPLIACILLVLWGTVSSEVTSCTKLSSCSCETPDGGVIDLSPLANEDNQPRFKDLPDDIGLYLYSWNPCRAFNETPGYCVDVAGCQVLPSISSSFSIGTQESALFVYDEERGLQIKYEANTDRFRTTFVSLICYPELVGNLTFDGELPPGSTLYYFSLRSKYACATPGNKTTSIKPSTQSTTSIKPKTAPSPDTAPPTPAPTSPTPDVFSIKMVVLLLFCIIFLLTIIMLLLFFILIAAISHRKR